MRVMTSHKHLAFGRGLPAAAFAGHRLFSFQEQAHSDIIQMSIRQGDA